MAELELLDALRAYPGGIAALAAAVGCSRQSVYHLARGAHGRPPVRLIRAAAAVLRKAPEPCRRLGSFDRLLAAWTRAHEAVD